ncbi:hypothetical protein EVA_05923, partial [gut metagenome]
NQLLDTTAIEQTVAKNYLSISEEEAIALIKGAAAFQENGKFNPALYERFLQSQGKSDQQFAGKSVILLRVRLSLLLLPARIRCLTT